DAQRTEHALGIVNLEPVDTKTFADRILDLLDVDAIHGASAGALVAADAGRQVEAMKTPIARPNRHRQLRILKLMSECLALVRLKEVPESYIHSLGDRLNSQDDISKPLTHRKLTEKVLCESSAQV